MCRRDTCRGTGGLPRVLAESWDESLRGLLSPPRDERPLPLRRDPVEMIIIRTRRNILFNIQEMNDILGDPACLVSLHNF